MRGCRAAVRGRGGRGARAHLDDDAAFQTAIDVHAARRLGITPLPVRTTAFSAQAPTPAPQPAGEPAPAGARATSAPPPVEPAPPGAPPRPKDRLEHWKSKLLDLSMFNRLLNFVETKKVVPLAAHDLGALEDRLQQRGRLQVHARPQLGGAEDPRDLEVTKERTGVDITANYLADELQAGRLRSTLEPAELDARLVEIFRHARTSLEESGANTLYLAIGFLHWYESPQSTKARRAPLLLLPLVAERSSVREGVRFVLDDAEPRLNQTLLQLLQRDFDLRVDLGEEPPEDEHGVDVAAVLDAFRVAALAMPRWEVVAEACVGFFSFTKYLMWLDLAARDDLLASPVLRHLVQTPGERFEQDQPEVPRGELDDVDPAEIFCPKDADSSQLAAVLAGAAGRTFVLEGPPGTGKSQTITNLIVQALANDKRVLFVAEKRAALEVVQRRLHEVGVAPFALELHSSKSGPRAVHDQLRRTLDFGARREPAEWRRVAERLQQDRERLNGFVEALHRRREHGESVFDAMGRLVQLRLAGTVPLPALSLTDAAAIERARAAVTELHTAAGVLGVPVDEPWWGVERGEWTPATSREVEPKIVRLRAAAEALQAAADAFRAALVGDAAFAGGDVSRAQLGPLLELAGMFTAPSLPPGGLLRAADWATLEPTIAAWAKAGARRDELWQPLAERWRAELLDLDLDALLARYLHAQGAFFVVRWWRLRGPRRELAAVAVGGRVGGVAAVRADLERARSARDEQRKLADGAAAAQVLGAALQDGRADWPKVLGWLQWVRAARGLLLQLAPGALAVPPELLAAMAERLDGLAEGSAVLPQRIAALQQAHDEFAAARAAIVRYLELDEDRAFAPAARADFLGAVTARCARWSDAVPRLRDHCAYVRAAQTATAADLQPLVDAHASGALATTALPDVFERTWRQAWLDGVHAAEAALARFRGVEHERTIAEFAELDQRAMRLAAEVAAARLAARLPQVRDTQVASSELGILERELKKQRRHKPVRRLCAEIPNLLGKLAPCLLMSPLSVVQYLGRGALPFDVVVFDEASQMPIWDAVPAIGRGRAAVIVGDSRQLPPTSFFQRIEQGDEPQPDDLPEDLESVLDECGAAGLPRMHLDWHYRSRHESLIAFSNHHYYDNRLLTFPAPTPAAAGMGVRLQHVEGIYDRGGSQQNRIEAEALVAEVVAHLTDPARQRRSVGIVTFSRAQQQLVEDLLDRARRERPEIEPFFANEHEPVFVKNLENVQGDERDTILFSICYGPDAAGKLYENYGPINAQGGERRLNVAVTRARRELVVFASMRADQVANRSAALGAKHLRAFLDYAERGQEALRAAVSVDPRADVESPFEAEVKQALEQRGYEVHAQVGCSGYRIDLAVVDARAPGRYLLGIECDGATYHSAATARDRDRLRAAVLSGLGWRLHRIWSTDFWQDPRGEIERAIAAIAAAAAAPLEAPAAQVAAPPPVEVAPAEVAPVEVALAEAAAVEVAPEELAPAPVDADGPRPYVAASLPPAANPDAFDAAAASAVLQAQLAIVLEAEAPIVADRLARTVADAWQISRVTERVRERILAALPGAASRDGDVVWGGGQTAEAFVGFRVPGEGDGKARSAEELPAVEVDNAMRWLLRQHGALAEDDLARETARAFGIQRLGSVVRGVMTEGIARLEQRGEVRRDGGTVRGA
ncbi:MAG: DUF3320 domain-containing protein [Planctomycetes bacterium]|nr:DUF3320 domain-containing protein [Planctomycetota bacterium]